MAVTDRRQGGFTLIELAVVLVVVAFVLGGMLLPLATQVDARKVQETREQLRVIKQALVGFAQVNGRLPCPATHLTGGVELSSVSNGVEEGCRDGTGFVPYGFVPATTLGISGSVDANGLLADAWGNPFRYSVTQARADIDTDGDDDWYFVTDDGLRSAGIQNLNPNLIVCDASAPSPPDASPGSSSTSDCGANGITLTTEAPAVFFSTGPDGAAMPGYSVFSRYQLENAGEIGLPVLALKLGTLWVPGDNVFVAGTRRGEAETAFAYFDDIVDWLSPVVLYERMIAAGRLP